MTNIPDLGLDTGDQAMIPMPTTTTSCTLTPAHVPAIALCLAIAPCPDIGRILIWGTRDLDMEDLGMADLLMADLLTEDLLTEARRTEVPHIHLPHPDHILRRRILPASLGPMRAVLVVHLVMVQFQCQRVLRTEGASC